MNAVERGQLAWRHYEGPLSHVAVLLAVIDHTDQDGRAYPSERRLATVARVSERTVRDALKELELRGVLKREPRSGPPGSGRLTLYTVVDEVLLASPHVSGDECRCLAVTGRSRHSPATGNSCRSSEPTKDLDRQIPAAVSGNSFQGKKTSEESPPKPPRARRGADSILAREIREAIRSRPGGAALELLSEPAKKVVAELGGLQRLRETRDADFERVVRDGARRLRLGGAA